MSYPDIWGVKKNNFFLDKEGSYQNKLDSASSDKESQNAYNTLARIAKAYNVNVENLFDLLHRGE